MRQSLKKDEILRGYGAFKNVLDQGRIYTGKRLKIFVLSISQDEPGSQRPLVGFGVGRKVESAVMRNRLKRLMREVVRRNKLFFYECCREASVSRLLMMCSPHSHRTTGRPGPGYQELESEFRTLMKQISHR